MSLHKIVALGNLTNSIYLRMDVAMVGSKQRRIGSRCNNPPENVADPTVIVLLRIIARDLPLSIGSYIRSN
jgi:hypothetical protein